MVQIIQERPKETFRDRFARAFGNASATAAQEIPQELMGRAERKQLGDLIGQDLSNIRNPDFLKMITQSGLQQQREAQTGAADSKAEQENYETIKNAFGEDFAKVWKATGQGERTGLVSAALQQAARGRPVEEIFGKKSSSEVQQGKGEEYKLNTENMTPKEVIDYKSSLRKENLPIWKEAVDKFKGNRELDSDIGILNKLNEKKNLPEKFGKLLINPETGAPYELVSAVKNMHPDVQQWVKTIARQASQAQTAFPGRVTNFDLMNYMRQFPNLFNTYEGRKVILQQMKITNDSHKLYNEALNKIYSKNKLNGITPEDAEELAYQSVREKLEDNNKKLLELASEGEILSFEDNDMTRSQNKTVDVIGPDGQLYEIDEDEIRLLPEGYRLK